MIRALTVVIMMLAFVVIGITTTWGKPHDFKLVTYVPLWSWLLPVAVIVIVRPWRKQ